MKNSLKRMICAGFMAGALQVSGQVKIPDYYHTPEAYQELKEAGKLPKGNNIVVLAPPRDSTPAIKELRGGSSPCGCYIVPDATYILAMAPNDDGSSNQISIPFNFCLYGTNYNSLYINNNGNVSFGTPYGTFSASGFPDPNFVMVAPFWADVDTRNGLGQVVYKITPTAIIVNWEDVGYFNIHGDKRNTFQLILTDGTDPIIGVGNNVAFCYQEMEWTTGDASSGVNGFGGVAANVGANKGNGTDYIQFGRFDQPGNSYDGPFAANDGVDYLDYTSYKFNVCVTGNNVAPLITSFQPAALNAANACGDTLTICANGDTLVMQAQAIDPNNGQTITMTANAPGVSGFSILANTPGNPADIAVQIVANSANAGYNYIEITATDNGSPVMSTTYGFYVYVDTTGLSNFNPVITGDNEICPNEVTSFDVGAGYDSYSWSTGSAAQSITNQNTDGLYWVTVSLNGCFKTVFTELTVHPEPSPNIYGGLNYCNVPNTTLTTDNFYTAYTWVNNASTVSNTNSATVVAGTVTLTVTDTNGCVGDTTVTVTNSLPQVNVSGTTNICAGTPVLLVASTIGNQPGTYQWSNGSANDSIYVNVSDIYTVVFTDQGGCQDSSFFNVNFFPVPNAEFSFSPDTAYDLTTIVSFTDQSTIASPGTIVGWNWTMSDTSAYNVQHPSHVFDHYGTYSITLYVISANGCIDSVTHTFDVIAPLMVPNVFTPGTSGGSNDLLVFKNLEFYGPAPLLIFNRWGNLVYESTDYKNNWDGKKNGNKLADGTYYFILTLKDGKVKKGTINIFGN